MAGDQSLWQLALLSAVYSLDLVVFVGLCRNEFRDGRRDHRRNKTTAAARRAGSAMVAGDIA